MKHPLFNIFLLGLLAQTLSAQITADSAQTLSLIGLITNTAEEPLVGATVVWKNSNTGVTTDTLGRFAIPGRTQADSLYIRYSGHLPTAVEVLPGENNLWIEVSGVQLLTEVQINAHAFDNATSLLETRNIESIHGKELRKAPCCNLSESFETNGAVDVSYADPLTGVREIQMLGLRGIYSQFLLENRPTLGGIATPFAFEMIPGSWLNGIQLAKGASTVQNGYAGITGQINAELVKPQSDKPVFINAFAGTEGRGELNVHLNRKGQGHFSHGLLTHASVVENRRDMNNDNFYDMPSRRQLNGLYRMFYESDGICGQFNIQALTDHRAGGQIDPIEGITQRFAIDQQNDRVEAWGKFGKEGLFGKQYNQWGNMLSASWHRSDALYGRNVYRATQRSMYWQSLYQTIIGNTNHKLLMAPSFQYDGIDERVNDTDLSRTEAVPGAMLEYTYSRPNLDRGVPDLVLVFGARADWNSRFGWFFTPRMSAKYAFSEKSTLRASAGYGYRSPNLIAENISVLASNRTLHIANDIRYEAAWNYGLNFTQEFKLWQRAASLSVDAFRTDFDKQVLTDVDASPTDVYFRYAEGPSWANSLLGLLQVNAAKGLDLKCAWKWNDVHAQYAGGKYDTPPLIVRHRALVAATYETPNKRWMFNAHVPITGPQRLPDNSDVPHELHHDHSLMESSPWYALLNAQVTYRWKKMELYIGGENLTGYRQHDVIVSPNDPWSPYFNATQVWAPLMGAIGYIGIRVSPSGI
jgi:hypothetical protein